MMNVAEKENQGLIIVDITILSESTLQTKLRDLRKRGDDESRANYLQGM